MFVEKSKIEAAKNADLIEFLEEKYPHLIEYNRKRKSYRHTDHDSLVINSEFWYQFSQSRGGDQISFVMEFCNKTFPEAVEELSQFSDISCADAKSPKDIKRSDTVLTDENIIDENFTAPAKKSYAKNVRNYLYNRGIPYATTDMLIDQNLLYEDYRRNCVFYCETQKMCILRGTREEKWMKIIRAIPNSYWFFKKGKNPADIYICESPVDAISVYECNHHRDGYYCALAGLKNRTYLRIVRDLAIDGAGNLCKNLKLAVDWDAAGKNFLDNEIDRTYKFVALRPTAQEMDKCKDWNDVLQLRAKTRLIWYYK